MAVVKIVRLKTSIFPWVATQQHWVRLTFFIDSRTKSTEITLEIAKLWACQCPEHVKDGHSLCLKTRFLTMPAKQCLGQQHLLSEVTEDHTNKLVKNGTELSRSPTPCIDISSWSMSLTPKVFPSTPLWHLHRAGGDLLDHSIQSTLTTAEASIKGPFPMTCTHKCPAMSFRPVGKDQLWYL